MSSNVEYTLRPLTIGEIFDRAVTLYVRNFVAFTLMVLTLLAPIAVVQYFVIPDQTSSLSQAIGQIGQPKSAAKKPPMPAPEIAGLLTIVALALIFAPFVNNAVAVGVARLYNGLRPDYGPSFAAVFRRWLPLIGTAILNMLILAGLYIVVVFGLTAIVVIVMLTGKGALAVAMIAVIVGIVALLAALLAFLLLVIAYVFAMYATSLENVSPTRAIGLAYRRLFNRSEFKKALLMALAYIGLELGVLTLSSMVGLLLLFVVKSYALELAVNSIVSAMLTAFLTILLAVYYFDVRTRSEGLDLETDLHRLAPPAPASAP